VKRILLAEDREDDIVLARRVLKKILGECEITIARDGEEALGLLLDQPSDSFDLVFMDIQMPGLDGLTILERIRSDGRLVKVPVVMLSTSSNAADVDLARSLGSSAYIVKPLGLREFEAEMGAVVHKLL
jgi:CheY-like chemotaxis protein